MVSSSFFLLSSSLPLSLPSTPTFAKHLYAPGLGAQDTEMNPTQSLPSGSYWSWEAANKGQTNNHERWEFALSHKCCGGPEEHDVDQEGGWEAPQSRQWAS